MLLLFIYLGFIYSLSSVDLYLYTSENNQEGIGFKGGEFTVTHHPIMLTIERINNSYYLRAAKNNYLKLDKEHLIPSLTKSSWILRKNKNLSDRTGIGHYQLENNSKCLLKAHGKLQAGKCDITSESQMLFFVTPNNGTNKAEINKFFDAAIDAEIRVVDKTVRDAPEKEEGQFYQIMIKKDVKVVTKTVMLQEVPQYIEKDSLQNKAEDAARLASERRELEQQAKDRQRRLDKDKPIKRVRRSGRPQRGRQGRMPQGDESSDEGFASDDQSQPESDDGSKRNRPRQTSGKGAGKKGKGRNGDEDSGPTGQGQGKNGQGKDGQGKDGQGKNGQGKGGPGGRGGQDSQGSGGPGGRGGKGGRGGPKADFSSDGKDGYSAPRKAGAMRNPKASGYLSPDDQGYSSEDSSDSGSRGDSSGKKGAGKNTPLSGTGIESVPGLIDDILGDSSKKSRDDVDKAFESLKSSLGRSAGGENSASGRGSNSKSGSGLGSGSGVRYEPRVQITATGGNVPGKDVKKLNLNFGGGTGQNVQMSTTTNIVPVEAYNYNYQHNNSSSGQQQGNPSMGGRPF